MYNQDYVNQEYYENYDPDNIDENIENQNFYINAEEEEAIEEI